MYLGAGVCNCQYYYEVNGSEVGVSFFFLGLKVGVSWVEFFLCMLPPLEIDTISYIAKFIQML